MSNKIHGKMNISNQTLLELNIDNYYRVKSHFSFKSLFVLIQQYFPLIRNFPEQECSFLLAQYLMLRIEFLILINNTQDDIIIF